VAGKYTGIWMTKKKMPLTPEKLNEERRPE